MVRQIEAGTVYVLGALNLDLCGMPDGALRLGDSNPGRVTLSAGGVGHNIARGLARMGFAVELVAPLGDDMASGLLEAACRREGIGLAHAWRMEGRASPTYLCLQGTDGDLHAAVNDMTLLDGFTGAMVAQRLTLLDAAPLVVCDANLPEDALHLLAERCRAPLFLDPVSGFKAMRARPVIGRFFAVKPNRIEAQLLSGESDMDRAADWFLQRGVRRLFLSLGEEGLLYADEGARGVLSPPPLAVRSASGAGDAMGAGLAGGLLLGLSTRACAERGIEAARRHLAAAAEASTLS